MRKYATGTRWCVWRWTELDSGQIDRLHIIKTAWFNICLHWLNTADPEPFPHDHPVTFLSIILEGAYVELRNGALRARNSFNFIRASKDDTHRIVWVAPHTRTLCVMGPKRREWGFHTPNGWMMWRDYYAEQQSKETVK